jgi:hypothetical protein
MSELKYEIEQIDDYLAANEPTNIPTPKGKQKL